MHFSPAPTLGQLSEAGHQKALNRKHCAPHGRHNPSRIAATQKSNSCSKEYGRAVELTRDIDTGQRSIDDKTRR
jgi:hypothetical protein